MESNAGFNNSTKPVTSPNPQWSGPKKFHQVSDTTGALREELISRSCRLRDTAIASTVAHGKRAKTTSI